MAKKAIVALGVVGFAACGLISASFTADGVQTANAVNKKNGGCNDGAMLEWSFSRAELTKGYSVPEACIDSLSEVSLHGEAVLTSSTVADDSCKDKPTSGKFTLSNVIVTADLGGSSETYTITCPSQTADITSNADVSGKIQDCLDLLGGKDPSSATAGEVREFVRKMLNANATSVHVKANGTCTPDSCFNIAYSGHLKAKGVIKSGNCKK